MSLCHNGQFCDSRSAHHPDSVTVQRTKGSLGSSLGCGTRMMLPVLSRFNVGSRFHSWSKTFAVPGTFFALGSRIPRGMIVSTWMYDSGETGVLNGC
jgi:hypothetical protein